MNVYQRILFLFIAVVAFGVLSGFSEADQGAEQTDSVTPMLTTGDRKADVHNLKRIVEGAAERGEITNANTERSLLLHLTAVEFYVDQGTSDKALDQLRRFEALVGQHQNLGTIERTRAIFIRKTTALLSFHWSQMDDGSITTESTEEK